MKNTFRLLSAVLIAGSLMSLSACGGGGGGGGDSFTPITYTGATTAATIDNNNADELVTLAYTGSDLGNLMPLARATDGGAAVVVPVPMLQSLTSLSRALLGYASNLPLETVPPAAAISIPAETQNCASAGSMTMSGTWDNVNGTISVDISFSACNQGEAILNGEASMFLSSNLVDADGFPDLLNSTIITTSQTYRNLSMTFLTGASMTVYGAIGMEINQAGANDVIDMTMGLVMRDGATGFTSKVENYHVIVTDYLTYEKINIVSARIYDYIHGFVDVSTPTPLQDDGIAQYPYLGILRLVGDNGSWAEVDFSFLTPQVTGNDGLVGFGPFDLL